MKKGYWVLRTYTARHVQEKIKYYVPGERPTRSQRKIKSFIKKQEQNDASAEKQLARLLNLNFESGDLLIGLDYSNEALERISRIISEDKSVSDEEECVWLEATKQLSLFFRRVKRELKKFDIDVKATSITSDLDGESKESVRVHHHIVCKAINANGEVITPFRQKEINKTLCKIMSDKWTNGNVNVKRLKKQDDYTPIAHYFIRQVRHVPDAKKYTTTRNLIRPVFKDRIVNTNAEIKIPARCKLLHRTEYTAYKPQYVRYLLPEVNEKRSN